MKPLTLVTGGSGFVGRHLLEAAAVESVRTRLVLRRDKNTALPNRLEVDSVKHTMDLFSESANWWADACQHVDTVIHLAWYAEPGKYLYSPLNIGCLQGTLALAQGSINAGVRRFIGIGTCLEYARSDAPLTASSPLDPTTPYAAAKAAAFIALSHGLRTANVDFAWCRLFHMRGRGEDPRRLTAAIRNSLSRHEPIALTEGHQVRDFLDVAEVGKRILAVAQSDLTGPINICSGVPITVRMLAESIADEFGRRHLLRFGQLQAQRDENPYLVGVPNDGYSCK